MAKKKSKSMDLSKLGLAVALLFGIVSVCMLFLPSVIWSDANYSGFQTMFGCETEKVFGASVEIFAFSFMNLLTLILAVVGILLSAFNLVSNNSNKLFAFIGAAAFVVSAVFFFLTPSFSIPMILGSSVQGSVELSLGIGSILGGVFSALAAAGSVTSMLD